MLIFGIHSSLKWSAVDCLDVLCCCRVGLRWHHLNHLLRHGVWLWKDPGTFQKPSNLIWVPGSFLSQTPSPKRGFANILLTSFLVLPPCKPSNLICVAIEFNPFAICRYSLAQMDRTLFTKWLVNSDFFPINARKFLLFRPVHSAQDYVSRHCCG